MALRLSDTSEKTIRKHAEEAYPNECCGFLYGRDTDDRFIETAIPVPNSKEGDQRRRFEISAADYMKAEHYALENNIPLLGIYHSHPDHPAVPSEHDRKQAMPFFSYVIISVQSKKTADIRSWILSNQEQFEEEAIRNL